MDNLQLSSTIVPPPHCSIIHYRHTTKLCCIVTVRSIVLSETRCIAFWNAVPCTVEQYFALHYVSVDGGAVSHYLRYLDRRGDKKDKIKPQSGRPSLTGPLSKRLQYWTDYSTSGKYRHTQVEAKEWVQGGITRGVNKLGRSRRCCSCERDCNSSQS